MGILVAWLRWPVVASLVAYCRSGETEVLTSIELADILSSGRLNIRLQYVDEVPMIIQDFASVGEELIEMMRYLRSNA